MIEINSCFLDEPVQSCKNSLFGRGCQKDFDDHMRTSIRSYFIQLKQEWGGNEIKLK